MILLSAEDTSECLLKLFAEISSLILASSRRASRWELLKVTFLPDLWIKGEVDFESSDWATNITLGKMRSRAHVKIDINKKVKINLSFYQKLTIFFYRDSFKFISVCNSFFETYFINSSSSLLIPEIIRNFAFIFNQ